LAKVLVRPGMINGDEKFDIIRTSAGTMGYSPHRDESIGGVACLVTGDHFFTSEEPTVIDQL
jgi:hypothetical protein